MRTGTIMELHIVIPALNEEAAIVSIIERTLAARDTIVRSSPVTAVRITVVSDGSTDRTVERARRFVPAIDFVVFERNRGYGAAIQDGWRRSDAALLGFLDADGTCDPQFFAELCRALARERADMAVGCRRHAGTRMPLPRRVGNALFAWLLTGISLARVRDAASGMRVVRREALQDLLPLPSGLHFTPAMSARVALSRTLKSVEVDMPYEERVGRSKLRPFRDGLRFLGVILRTAFLHRPSRPLGFLAAAALVFAMAIMVRPVLLYAREGRLEEWMIYRLIVAEIAGGGAFLLWCSSYLGRKAVDVALARHPAAEKYHGFWGAFFRWRWFWTAPVLGIAAAAALLWRSFVSYASTGTIQEHWSRFIAASFLVWVSMILSVTKVVDASLNLLAGRLEYLKRDEAPVDRTPEAAPVSAPAPMPPAEREIEAGAEGP